jgi:hypothetical protein
VVNCSGASTAETPATFGNSIKPKLFLFLFFPGRSRFCLLFLLVSHSGSRVNVNIREFVELLPAHFSIKSSSLFVYSFLNFQTQNSVFVAQQKHKKCINVAITKTSDTELPIGKHLHNCNVFFLSFFGKETKLWMQVERQEKKGQLGKLQSRKREKVLFAFVAGCTKMVLLSCTAQQRTAEVLSSCAIILFCRRLRDDSCGF